MIDWKEVRLEEIFLLRAECNECKQISTATVDPADWIMYCKGEGNSRFVQDIWPEKSISEREVIVANRPNNIFGKLGFYCTTCTEKFKEEEDENEF